MKNKKNIFIAVCAVLILLCGLIPHEGLYSQMIYVIATRIIGTAVFAVILWGKNVWRVKCRRLWYITLLTSLVIAVNNAPLVAAIQGGVAVDQPYYAVLLLAAESIAVGLFEEIAFRGFLLPFVYEQIGDRKYRVFLSVLLSSVVFALIHLVNLFYGNPGAVIMQVGYSFLVGGMCGALMADTGSVLVCAAVHALYDFCGAVIPRLGHGEVWVSGEIILTAAVTAVIAVYYIIHLIRSEAEL